MLVEDVVNRVFECGLGHQSFGLGLRLGGENRFFTGGVNAVELTGEI